MLLGQALEPDRDVLEERDLAGDRAGVQRLEVRRLTERDAEVPRVKARRFLDRGRALGEVADQLVAEEIQRYPVRIAAGELAAEHGHVEVLGRIEVLHG